MKPMNLIKIQNVYNGTMGRQMATHQLFQFLSLLSNIAKVEFQKCKYIGLLICVCRI